MLNAIQIYIDAFCELIGTPFISDEYYLHGYGPENIPGVYQIPRIDHMFSIHYWVSGHEYSFNLEYFSKTHKPNPLYEYYKNLPEDSLGKNFYRWEVFTDRKGNNTEIFCFVHEKYPLTAKAIGKRLIILFTLIFFIISSLIIYSLRKRNNKKFNKK